SLPLDYIFNHWETIIYPGWAEVIIDTPNSPTTGITTQSGAPGALLAYVTPIISEASAYIPEIDYWVEGMPGWGIMWSDPTGPVPVAPPNYSDRPAEVGEAMYLGVWWHNTGEVTVTGHVDLELTAPSGAKHILIASSGQDETQKPNSGAAVVFNPFTLNEAGTWSLKATLSHAGGTLDEETTSFTVEEAPVGIPTTPNINAPNEVSPGETFNIFGQLTRDDTGEAIPNMSISVSYNGTPLGSVLTDMQGVYTIPASIPDPGTYTLRADFLGTLEYAASRSTADTIVAATPLEAALKIAGPAVTGLALIMYSLS
ncbi:unnamed protein product, partial [marine sediment metagenome]